MKLDRTQILIDTAAYPRLRPNPQTIRRYAKAMKAGALFPPIVVGKRNGTYVLLDGRQRLRAYALRRVRSVEVTVSAVPPEQFLEEATRLNIAHGAQLSRDDQARVARRLSTAGYEALRVATILCLTVTDVTALLVDRATFSRLRTVRPASALAEDPLRWAAQRSVLRQAVALFESGVVLAHDKEIIALSARLHRAIRSWMTRLTKSA